MSREIKFRAWDGVKMRGVDKNDYFSIRNDGLPSQNIDVVLTQFTGLRDSNESDIYEGDILDEHFKAIVSFKKGSYIVSNKYNKHVKGLLSDFLRLRTQAVDKCEIVGNIFES